MAAIQNLTFPDAEALEKQLSENVLLSRYVAENSVILNRVINVASTHFANVQFLKSQVHEEAGKVFTAVKEEEDALGAKRYAFEFAGKDTIFEGQFTMCLEQALLKTATVKEAEGCVIA